MVRIATACGLTLILAACGELETPDLGRGAVAGRIAGASPGAYAYVYGAPQLKADLAPDGTFEIAGVPAGSASVVLFDGATHAELAAVEVQGASRSWIDRTAAAMPLAGRIVVAVRPEGGTAGAAAVYGMPGTILTGVRPALGAYSAELWPLPPASFVAAGELPGFLAGTAVVAVAGGSTIPAEIFLGIDVASATPGCRADPNLCRSPLVCDPTGGWCYECVSDGNCLTSERCVGHACVAATGGRVICEPCSADADCTSGGPCLGYCSKPCASSSDCPAGLACAAVGPGTACVAPLGCDALAAAFGAPCVADSGCADAIAGGICPLPPGAEEGVCTASCLTAADCSAAVGLPYCSAGGRCSSVP